MTSIYRIFIIATGFCLITGCASMGASPQAKRQAILKMKDEALTTLFQSTPKARTQISNAPGYGVFSNASIKPLFGSVGGGHGMVKDNRSGAITFMKMAEVGLGPGFGVTDDRMILIFDNRQRMEDFIAQGWMFGAQADAAAKASDNGAAVGVEAAASKITIYKITESGLSLQATVKGTKFWKDKELNATTGKPKKQNESN